MKTISPEQIAAEVFKQRRWEDIKNDDGKPDVDVAFSCFQEDVHDELIKFVEDQNNLDEINALSENMNNYFEKGKKTIQLDNGVLAQEIEYNQDAINTFVKMYDDYMIEVSDKNNVLSFKAKIKFNISEENEKEPMVDEEIINIHTDDINSRWYQLNVNDANRMENLLNSIENRMMERVGLEYDIYDHVFEVEVI